MIQNILFTISRKKLEITKAFTRNLYRIIHCLSPPHKIDEILAINIFHLFLKNDIKLN